MPSNISSTILSDIKAECVKQIAGLNEQVSEEIARRGGVDEEKETQDNFTTLRIAMLDFMIESYDPEKINTEAIFNTAVHMTMRRMHIAVRVLAS
jgi:hypothetical protein